MGKFFDDIKSEIIKNVLIEICGEIDKKIDSKRKKEPIERPVLTDEEREYYRQEYLRHEKEKEEDERRERNTTITACCAAGIFIFVMFKILKFLFS